MSPRIRLFDDTLRLRGRARTGLYIEDDPGEPAVNPYKLDRVPESVEGLQQINEQVDGTNPSRVSRGTMDTIPSPAGEEATVHLGARAAACGPTAEVRTPRLHL